MDSNLKCDVCGESNFNVKEGFYYCNECGTQLKQIRDLEVEVTGFGEEHNRRTTMKIRSKVADKVEITTWECYNYILRGLVEELLAAGAREELKPIVLQLWSAYLRQSEVAFFSKHYAQLPKLGIRYSTRDAKILYNHELRRKSSKKRKSSAVSSSLGEKRAWQRQKTKLAKAEYETSRSEFSQSMSSFYSTSISQMSSSSGNSLQPIRLKFTNKAKKLLKTRIPAAHLRKHEEDGKNELTCHNLRVLVGNLNHREISDQLKRSTLYAILYVALNLIEDDIQLSDLIRFMREGHISSRCVSHLFPENISTTCEEVIKSIQFFRGVNIFPDCQLRKNSLNLCRQIHLSDFKTPDIFKLSLRYATDLNLPENISVYLERLINIYPSKMKAKMTERTTPCFEGRAMAYIVFLLKLLFGLDGSKEYLISESATLINQELQNLKIEQTLFVWEDWVQYIEMRKIILSQCHLPTSLQFKEHLNRDEYLKHLKETYRVTTEEVVKHKRTKLLNMERIFETFYDNYKTSTESTSTSDSEVKKFPPTLTPNSSYFRLILQEYNQNISIPKFMYRDFSQSSFEPFLNAKKLRNILTENEIKLNIEKIACTEKRNFVGVVRNFYQIKRGQEYDKGRLRKADFNIGEEEWLKEVNTKYDDNTIIYKNLEKKFKEKKKKRIEVTEKSGEHSPVERTVSADLFNETMLSNPGIELKPRRNLDNEELFAGLSDTDANENDDENSELKFRKTIDFKVSNLDYWILLAKIKELTILNKTELKNQLPLSLFWLLDTCSKMIGIEWDVLYQELLAIEVNFIYILEPMENVKNCLKFREEQQFEDISRIVSHFKLFW